MMTITFTKFITINKNKTRSNAVTRSRKSVTRRVIRRSTTSIFQVIDIFNNEINDDEFNNLKFSDDDFHTSRNENEMIANE